MDLESEDMRGLGVKASTNTKNNTFSKNSWGGVPYDPKSTSLGPYYSPEKHEVATLGLTIFCGQFTFAVWYICSRPTYILYLKWLDGMAFGTLCNIPHQLLGIPTSHPKHTK